MPPGSFYLVQDGPETRRFEVVMDRAIYVAEAEAELQQRGITAQKESALPPGRAMLFGHFALEVTPDELTVAREVITGPMHLDYLQPKE